ncbi:uncharacterized protein LOC109503023 [Felis catus]|uniref:uncharacterized protein LOC109503023 n=1 Tax=Felis catus TaxID=9685 RepID=UPI000C2FB8B6|nr:uncharacterized protein LOC109503023 [Felis catus]
MMPEGPSKTSGLPSLLVTLEGEPSGETLPQPSPKSLTSSSRKWFSRKSQRWLSPRARRSRRAWFRIFPRTLAASLASRVLPPLLSRRLLYFPEKGTKPPPPPRCFCIFKGGWVISLLLANGQKWPTPCGATPSRPDRSPEKGRQVHLCEGLLGSNIFCSSHIWTFVKSSCPEFSSRWKFISSMTSVLPFCSIAIQDFQALLCMLFLEISSASDAVMRMSASVLLQ